MGNETWAGHKHAGPSRGVIPTGVAVPRAGTSSRGHVTLVIASLLPWPQTALSSAAVLRSVAALFPPEAAVIVQRLADDVTERCVVDVGWEERGRGVDGP